jgi:restriction system protein
MSLLKRFKGWFGEALGAFGQWLLLDKSIYFRFNNVTLPTWRGTTQIDHVILSQYGIFVVESKTIDGFISGDEKSAQWLVERPGSKYLMNNPLHQNYGHVKAMMELLKVPQSKIHSVIMFWGDCEFRTIMPNNILTKGYINYIQSFQNILFSPNEVAILVTTLRNAHVALLEKRHNEINLCPKCGHPLVLRNGYSKFYGCKAYPQCRYTSPYKEVNP